MKRVTTPTQRTGALGLLLLAAVPTMLGCRGGESSDPPLHLIGDMDWQPKYQSQKESPFFADGRSMRPHVEGTVAQGLLKEDDALHRGKIDEATYVAKVPMQVDERLMRRGQDRYAVFCTPCHDGAGSGQGMVVKRGFPPPVDLASERVRTMADGEIFEVISHGVRNMPSYKKQIPVEDRWAIVSWVRVLQRSQFASVADVPAERRDQIEAESGTP